MGKRHLSFTQIGMFLRCPRQYEFRYIQGLRRPPSGALVLGSSWHKAIERNYRQKVQTEIDLPLEDVQDCFSDAFDQAFTEDVELDEGEDKGQLKDTGVLITTEHHKLIAPKVRPLMVEQEFNLDLGAGFPYTLKGFWDVIEKDGTIADNKSYSKTPSQIRPRQGYPVLGIRNGLSGHPPEDRARTEDGLCYQNQDPKGHTASYEAVK